MKKLVAAVALTAAVLSVGYTGVDENTQVSCDGFQVAIFELAGERVVIRADGVTVFAGRITPYVTWSDSWPSERRNHRLVIRVDGVRSVFTVKGCR